MLKAFETLKSRGLVVHVSNLGLQETNFNEVNNILSTANKSYDDLGRTNNEKDSQLHNLITKTTVPIVRTADVLSKKKENNRNPNTSVSQVRSAMIENHNTSASRIRIKSIENHKTGASKVRDYLVSDVARQKQYLA